MSRHRNEIWRTKRLRRRQSPLLSPSALLGLSLLLTPSVAEGWKHVLLSPEAKSSVSAEPWNAWRGGSLESEGNGSDENSEPATSGMKMEANCEPSGPLAPSPPLAALGTKSCATTKASRQTSEFLEDLIRRSGVDERTESCNLRHLISNRKMTYLEKLYAEDSDSTQTPHTPNRAILQYLAPKIPAIKHSPEISLRIQSARSDVDAGVAAALIGTLAHAQELYERHLGSRRVASEKEEPYGPAGRSPKRVDTFHGEKLELIKDRRFEQLVECILCGVDVKMRMAEHARLNNDRKTGIHDIEEVLDRADSTPAYTEGLTIRDSCRAAWGLAVLGVHCLGTIGGERVLHILTALSLRIRELLLARLQLLRQDDLYSDFGREMSNLSLKERLMQRSEEIAEDAATAMWTFACVRVCTGLRTVPLFEACCLVLCQDPFALRRRAQDVELMSEKSNVGINDVVELLEKSETHGTEDESESESSQSEARGTLVNWLSPKEVIDILWALALHDSKEKDEAALSVTAAGLCEIAFDKMVQLLESELLSLRVCSYEKLTVEVADASSILASESSASSLESITITSPEKTESIRDVDVMDATAILSSVEHHDEEVARGLLTTIETETMAVESLNGHGGTEELHVVNAATLLATSPRSEREGLENASSDESLPLRASSQSDIPFDQEENPQKPNVGLPDFGDRDTSSTDILLASHEHPSRLARLQTFTPHDLCSLAWAATELRDSLRPYVTKMVMEIFMSLGSNSVMQLDGSDLTNLVWAVAKGHVSDEDETVLIEFADQVAQRSLKLIHESETQTENRGHYGASALIHFHPPELSRLLWSITSIYASSRHCGDRLESFERLATISLVVASSQIEAFGTEDLARIAWSFLELSDVKVSLGCPRIAHALGLILSTVEASLIFWESGTTTSLRNPESENATVKESIRFASVFGRTRFHFPLLDHKMDEGLENHVDSATHTLSEKSKLPLLREIPTDPSTLTKLACSFTKLSVERPSVDAMVTLNRVALRLLSSRGGRLIRDCPSEDIIRLCEAIAISKDSASNREVVSSFVRRLLKLLNDEGFDGKSSLFSNGRPRDVARLVWSLGELGVKHAPNADDPSTAYRRLQLTADRPFVLGDRVQELFNSDLVKLINGLSLLNVASTNTEYFTRVLYQMRERISSIDDVEDICMLAESIGSIESYLHTIHVRDDDDSPSKMTPTGSDYKRIDGCNDMVKNNAESEDIVEKETAKDVTSAAAQNKAVEASGVSGLLEACDDLFTALANKCSLLAGIMKPKEVRRILVVCSMTPIRADGLIDIIASEIQNRKEKLQCAQEIQNGKNLLSEAVANAKSAQSLLCGSNKEDSTFKAIRKGLRSFFRSSEDADEIPNTETIDMDVLEIDETEKLQIALEAALRSIIDLGDYADHVESSCCVTILDIQHQLEEGTLFDLGRCEELINLYRRIDFHESIRLSRFDDDRRTEMAKGVLTRLLP